MMLFITVAWLFLPNMVWCYDLLIIQSQRSPSYNEVLRGLRSASRFSERVIVLSDYNEIDLQRIAREETPLVIITLGDNALALARKVRQIPVIALMSLNFRPGIGGYPAITGVEVQLPPEKYMPVFTSIKAKKVGVISNSTLNSGYIRQARKIAATYGIDLVTSEVKSSRDVSGQLDSLAGVVDLLWMLPDRITSSGEAADAHFLFSARHKIPVVTFSSTYLASGAAIAVEFDRFDMGRQAGEMVISLQNGDEISDIPPESPRKTTVKSNSIVLRRLGINPDIARRWNSE